MLAGTLFMEVQRGMEQYTQSDLRGLSVRQRYHICNIFFRT
jgi:hypothetical protein